MIRALILFMVLTIQSLFCGETAPLSLSFQDLSEPAESQLYRKYHNKEVVIRGFIYETAGGEKILAAQPDVKSCCVGSKDKTSEQILLVGNITLEDASKAYLVQGKFVVDPKKDESNKIVSLYRLEEASIHPRGPMGLIKFIIAGALFFAVAYFLMRKK